MNSIVIHYHEIALKGRNRPQFIHQLVQNLKTVTADLDVRDARYCQMVIEPKLRKFREQLSKI